MTDYSEDGLVEQPSIELFGELGWETANGTIKFEGHLYNSPSATGFTIRKKGTNG